MNNTKIIIGAVYRVLMIAYLLQIDVLILSQLRNGGRIETVTGTTGATTMEMVPPGLVNRISILLPC
jgi:hypothetical protein